MKAIVLALLLGRSAGAVGVAEAPRVDAPAYSAASAAAASMAAFPVSLAALVPSLAAAPVAAPAVAAAAAPAAASADARFTRIGALVADRRAPGAAELAKALAGGPSQAAPSGRAFDGDAPGEKPTWPLLGIFEVKTARVLNGYSVGSFGVLGHSDAVPPAADRSRLGGYTLFVRRDGRMGFAGSGSVAADLTPAVRRAVLRYYGLRPAGETVAARLKRRALDLGDGLIAWTAR